MREEEALLRAVLLGQVEEVESILALAPDVNPNLKDDNGNRLLHLAVRYLHPSSNKKSTHAAYRSVQIIKHLVKAGAKPNYKNRGKDTPLTDFLAFTLAKEPSIAMALLQAGAKATIKRTPKAWTPLHWALFHNWPELVKALLTAGADPNEQLNQHRFTPLHMVASVEAGQYLVEYGADVNAISKEGLSPLEGALARLSSAEGLNTTKEELLAWCRVLIEAGADCNKIGPKGISVLQNAITRQCFDVARLIIAKGADITYSHKIYGGVLHSCAAVHAPDLLQQLLETGIDPNVTKRDGYTPLHYAVAGQLTENIKVLLHRGANPTIKNKYGQRPIDFAETEELLALLQ